MKTQNVRAIRSETEQQNFDAQLRAKFPDHNARAIDSLRENLDTWAMKFMENPVYQLVWADDIYRDAAEYEMRLGLSVWFDRNADSEEPKPETEIVQSFTDELTKDVIRGARNATHTSTGQSRNMMEEAKRLATADLLHQLVFRYGYTSIINID